MHLREYIKQNAFVNEQWTNDQIVATHQQATLSNFVAMGMSDRWDMSYRDATEATLGLILSSYEMI